MKIEINAYGTTMARLEADNFFIAHSITENMMSREMVRPEAEADLYCTLLDFFNNADQDQIMISGWLILKA